MEWIKSGGSYVVTGFNANPDDEFYAKRMANAPMPRTIRQSFYYAAFQELETERQIGMAAGYIPISKIRDWAEFHDLTKSETRALIHVITALDAWQMTFNSTHQSNAGKEHEKPK